MELAVAGLAVAVASLPYSQAQERLLQLVDTVAAVVVVIPQLPDRRAKYGWISFRDIKGRGLSLQ